MDINSVISSDINSDNLYYTKFVWDAASQASPINLWGKKLSMFLRSHCWPKILEITSVRAETGYANRSLTRSKWWNHQKLAKSLKSIDFIDFSIDEIIKKLK